MRDHPDANDESSVQIAIRSAAQRFGDRVAIRCDGHEQSFATTLDRAWRLGTALADLGVAEGARVAVLALNSPLYFEMYFAACEYGYIEAPLNNRLSAEELGRYLAHIEPVAIVTDAAHANLAEQLVAMTPSIKLVVGCGPRHGFDTDYEDLLAAVSPGAPALRNPDDIVLVCATSGTTGTLKSVAHTQRACAAGFGPLMDRFDINSDSHLVIGLSMFFATGCPLWYVGFAAGAVTTMLPRFDPDAFVEVVERDCATHTFVGPALVWLMQDAGIDFGRLGNLEVLSMGGAAADSARLQRLVNDLGARVAIQYAMTELSIGTGLRGSEFIASDGTLLPEHRAAGYPFKGLAARIVDDDGADVAHDGQTSGELLFAGPYVTAGYWKQPEVNDGAFTDDGWLRTGDVATIAPDGLIRVVDRKKDLIISGGFNVAPLDVELAIGAMPGVAAVGVCGVPHQLWGEAVHAAVVATPGVPVTAESVMDWCQDRLPPLKRPKTVEIVAQLPQSSVGKTLRREIRRDYLIRHSEGARS